MNYSSASDTAAATEVSAELKARLDERRATVAILGLGYVGLPLALAFHGAGFPVLGVDVDAGKVEKLSAGVSYIGSIPGDRVKRMADSGTFRATTDFATLAEADAIIICVPTPLDKYREPDLSFVVSTTKAIAPHLRPGHIVCLESTTYPGTTDEILKPILESGGLKAGKDFFLAYSPEREDPGNQHFDTVTIPKVVGGDDPTTLELAELLYSAAVAKVVPVSNTRTAEAVKITENIYRAVNIALVNELKVIYEAMGIDVWEVVDAAATKPFGFTPFYPGPGLGGHCIPIDPFYLTWKAREYGMHTRFIELSGEINRAMPRHVVTRVGDALSDHLCKPLKGARILLVGIAYKKNVDDMRESPSLEILEQLEARGAHVDFHDPFIAEVPPTREHGALTGRRSVSLTDDNLSGYDAAVIATDHDGVDWKLIAERLSLVIDTRNAMTRAGIDGANIVKA